MPSLKSVLRSHAALTPGLGRTRNTERTADALARDLRRVSESNRTYFTVCFVAVLLVFLGTGAIAVRYMNSPERITEIFGALGVSVMGLIAQMTSLWKQKVAADTLIVLCSVADDTLIQKIIDTLLTKL